MDLLIILAGAQPKYIAMRSTDPRCLPGRALPNRRAA